MKFSGPTCVTIPEQMEGIWKLEEDSGCRKIYQIPRDMSGAFVKFLMDYKPVDISVNEEDIGKIVERIYSGERSGL